MQLKTKEMTYTRISRALMHLLLNQKTLYPAGYNRVLGFRKSAGALLKEIRRRSSLPLIAKPHRCQKRTPLRFDLRPRPFSIRR